MFVSFVLLSEINNILAGNFHKIYKNNKDYFSAIGGLSFTELLIDNPLKKLHRRHTRLTAFKAQLEQMIVRDDVMKKEAKKLTFKKLYKKITRTKRRSTNRFKK